MGKPKDAEAAKNGTSAGKRAAFRCLMSGTPITYDYVREEAQAGRMGAKLMTIVAEGVRGRVYLAPTPEMRILHARRDRIGNQKFDLKESVVSMCQTMGWTPSVTSLPLANSWR